MKEYQGCLKNTYCASDLSSIHREDAEKRTDLTQATSEESEDLGINSKFLASLTKRIPSAIVGSQGRRNLQIFRDWAMNLTSRRQIVREKVKGKLNIQYEVQHLCIIKIQKNKELHPCGISAILKIFVKKFYWKGVEFYRGKSSWLLKKIGYSSDDNHNFTSDSPVVKHKILSKSFLLTMCWASGRLGT